MQCEKTLFSDFPNWPVMVMDSSSNETSYYLLQLSSYSGRDDNEEQFILEQDSLNCKMKNDQPYSHNEKEMLRHKERVSEGINSSYYKLDELVVGKYHNWSLSSNKRHTTVCRFCREEIKNYYYKNHFVRCSGQCLSECYASFLIAYKKSKQPLIPCKTVLEDLSEEAQDNDDDYPINCIAVQASDRW